MSLHIYHSKEEAIIKGCLKGDRTAQKSLYEMYAGQMHGICYRYLHDRMAAEDVVVTGFLKVFQRIAQFKGEGSFAGWIRRIMVNEALTHLRRNKAMYLEVGTEDYGNQPNYEQLDDNLQAEDLLKMIEALPSGYRIVFNLYAIDGYSHKEIAEQLGISESTSKSQLSRARTYLQNQLQKYELEGYKNVQV